MTITDIEIGNYVNEMSFLEEYNQSISKSLSHYSNIEQLTVGYNISRLPSLNNNSKLSILTILSPIPLDAYEFSNVQYMDLDVKIPYGSISKFKEHPIWSKFWNISELPVIEASSISLNESNLKLYINQSFQLVAEIEPINVTNNVVIWETSDYSIANATQDGIITGINEGSVIITAKCGEISASCEVRVEPVLPEEVTLNELSISLKKNETFQLSATVSPEATTDKTIAWTSNNESIASVSDTGLVTANGIGNTQIVASCGEVSTICEVTVTPILAEGLTLNENSISVTKGNTFQLVAAIDPEDTTDKTIAWVSDNEKVAKVSNNGLVTAVEVGNAKITASCGDVSATCEVVVTDIDGVGYIINEDEQINVYTVNGVLIKERIHAKELDDLAPGIYIIQTLKGSFKIQK